MDNALTVLMWAIAVGVMFVVGTTILRCFVALADAIADGMDERDRAKKIAAYELAKKIKQDAEAEAWRAKNPVQHHIDSADQELCGKWLAEMLTRFPITPATRLILQVRPFYVPNPENPWMGPMIPDWEADYQRWLGQTHLLAGRPDAAVELFESAAKKLESRIESAKPLDEKRRLALETVERYVDTVGALMQAER